MIGQLFPFLIILLVIGLIWVLIKLFLKLTTKIFSCGCVVILVIAVLIFFLSGNSIPFLK